MDIEINGQTYVTTQQFENPKWWNKWFKKNQKKKLKLFSKRIKGF
jgi:hypothetical protein